MASKWWTLLVVDAYTLALAALLLASGLLLVRRRDFVTVPAEAAAERGC